jgi:hypothetical protein
VDLAPLTHPAQESIWKPAQRTLYLKIDQTNHQMQELENHLFVD